MAETIISRAEATRLGLKRYFTGKPCPHGHNGERWVTSGACYECVRAKNPGVVKRWVAKQDPDEYRKARAQQTQLRKIRYPEKWELNLARLATVPRREREHYNQLARTRRQRNPELIRAQDRASQAKKLEDVQYRLRFALRTRLNIALKRGSRAGSAVRDLGCTIAEFKLWIEAQFEPGMSWGNWSRDGWHLDHIKPLANFDLTDRAQFLIACNYRNIRPMWGHKNIRRPRK